MHEILNRNLCYLEKRSQALANRLGEMSPDTSLELTNAASGDLTAIKYSGDGSHHFLHSRIDPRREAKIWTDNQCVIMPSLVIIGIGLAYHVFELLKRCGTVEKAYLVETDEGLFRLAMMVHDFSSLMQDTSVHFLIGASLLPSIPAIISTTLAQPFSCHVFPPVVSSSPDIYKSVRYLVEKHLCALRLAEDGGVERLLNQLGAP